MKANPARSQSPIFVVGHPRSGTTLVQLLICANPEISSAPETHLFSHVLKPIRNWRSGKIAAGDVPKILSRLAGKPGIRVPEGVAFEIQREAERGALGAAELLERLMRYFAEQNGQSSFRRWVEKTPRHVQYLPEILGLFPDARVVNVVRDARDVVSSHALFNGDRPGARRWQVMRRSRSWNRLVGLVSQNKPNPRIIDICYEDIIRDPAGSTEWLMRRVGEQFRPAYLERFAAGFDDVVLPNEVARKGLLRIGKIVDRRGIWKERLRPREAKLVEARCKTMMERYGYPAELTVDLSPLARSVFLFTEHLLSFPAVIAYPAWRFARQKLRQFHRGMGTGH